ncbi:MAG: MFS transporter [Planctomycetes bacterium]|nr:MFS transporter [Planctomycetota bacterium]
MHKTGNDIETAEIVEGGRLYTRRFFEAFAAVALFMTGLALQFHFGQYLEFRGHGVDVLGRVMAISTIGALVIRLQIGHWIDRFGCRPSWVIGASVTAVAVGAMQFAESLWMITALQTLTKAAAAVVMTTFAVFAAQIAPPGRRAESIGTMGMAGFTGMLVGPTLGDWVFSGDNTSIAPFRVFFTASAACALAAALAMLVVKLPKPVKAERSGQDQAVSRLTIIIRHWPGMVLLVGFFFSMAFCMQMVFLERLAEHAGFKDIKLFFLVYSPTAMTLRLVFRTAPQRFGRGRTLVGGMMLVSVGLCCLLGIRSQWQLIPAAILIGAGHCFVFPSLVDLAASRLPDTHRGMGTSIIFGAGDLGMLTGFWLLGELIDNFGFNVAIVALSSGVLASALLFALTRSPVSLGTPAERQAIDRA